MKSMHKLNYRRWGLVRALGTRDLFAHTKQTMSSHQPSSAGFSNLDFPEEVEHFIPSTATNFERASRRAHVISFCGGIIVGIFALLSVQWTSEFIWD